MPLLPLSSQSGCVGPSRTNQNSWILPRLFYLRSWDGNGSVPPVCAYCTRQRLLSCGHCLSLDLDLFGVSIFAAVIGRHQLTGAVAPWRRRGAGTRSSGPGGSGHFWLFFLDLRCSFSADGLLSSETGFQVQSSGIGKASWRPKADFNSAVPHLQHGGRSSSVGLSAASGVRQSPRLHLCKQLTSRTVVSFHKRLQR